MTQIDDEDVSWQSIVDTLFAVIAFNDRLAVKRRARGRHLRKRARHRARGTGR
jgi:hypothetical protein